MNNMLSKIEGLLSKKKAIPSMNESRDELRLGQDDRKEQSNATKDARAAMGEIVIDSKTSSDRNEEESESNNENKIDLNRMASLLNGFNN